MLPYGQSPTPLTRFTLLYLGPNAGHGERGNEIFMRSPALIFLGLLPLPTFALLLDIFARSAFARRRPTDAPAHRPATGAALPRAEICPLLERFPSVATDEGGRRDGET